MRRLAAFLAHIPQGARLSLGVSALYACTSVSLSMLNKSILSVTNFRCYFVLMFCQLLVSIVFCAYCKYRFKEWKWFQEHFSIPDVSLPLLQRALPMSLSAVLNISMNMVGLQLVNVPMFFALRRLVSPTVLLYEYLSFSRVPSRNICGSVVIVVAGVLLAAWETLVDGFLGYAITLTNNVVTAANTVMQKQFKEGGSERVSVLGMLYLNALIGAPLCLAAALVTGEFQTLYAFENLSSPFFLVGFSLSCCLATLMTYTSILSTTYNSPLATSITGNAKDVFATFFGWLVFTGFSATPLSVAGLALSFVGAFSYSYASLVEMQAAGSIGGGRSSEGGHGKDDGTSARIASDGSSDVPNSNESSGLLASRHSQDGPDSLQHRAEEGVRRSLLQLGVSSTAGPAISLPQTLPPPSSSTPTAIYGSGSDASRSPREISLPAPSTRSATTATSESFEDLLAEIDDDYDATAVLASSINTDTSASTAKPFVVRVGGTLS